MLLPYPTEIPTEAWAVLADAFRGNFPDKAQAAKVAWNVAGYALHVALPAGPGVAAAEASAPAPSDDPAALCEALAKGAKFGLDWRKFLPLIIELIKELTKS